jgi:hypothetical protein
VPGKSRTTPLIRASAGISPPRQDKIPQRHFTGSQVFPDAFVKAFVLATQQDQLRLLGQLLQQRLV